MQGTNNGIDLDTSLSTLLLLLLSTLCLWQTNTAIADTHAILKFESLRTTVPHSVVEQWKLKEGDKLDWSWEILENEIKLVVTKVSQPASAEAEFGLKVTAEGNVFVTKGTDDVSNVLAVTIALKPSGYPPFINSVVGGVAFVSGGFMYLGEVSIILTSVNPGLNAALYNKALLISALLHD